MLTAFVALIALICGVLWRELYEILKRIELASKVLVQRAQKEQQQEKKMKFADPVNWEELDDQEKIELLNP